MDQEKDIISMQVPAPHLEVKYAEKLLDEIYGTEKPSFSIFFSRFSSMVVTKNSLFTVDKMPSEPVFFFCSQPGKIYFLGILDPSITKVRVRASDLIHDLPSSKKKTTSPTTPTMHFPPWSSFIHPENGGNGSSEMSMTMESSDVLEIAHSLWMSIRYPGKYPVPECNLSMFYILLASLPDRMNQLFPHDNEESIQNLSIATRAFVPSKIETLPYAHRQIIEYLQTNLP